MAEHTNELIHESSPYLLQHAHNPVRWQPWGDAAFLEAGRRDVPVFLSIGYSTCHWCHVMERESFEDLEVAGLLNEHFVAIKVDREERPDIDHLYMNACTAMTGQGGWPLSCFLTPDKKPFFAGSYFPRRDAYGMRGFTTILETIRDLWQRDRERLLAASDEILSHIQSAALPERGRRDENAAKRAFEQLSSTFDKQYGGFGSAPKFPAAHNLLFLIRYYYLHKEPFAAQMVEATLKAMLRGGIWDHVGYGFCRYATDRRWLVPHFEKMMYDNAMLAIACCEAGAAIDNEFYAAARRILQYAFRDMHDGSGGFYTAQDADTEGEEGRYYLFTPQEIDSVLAPGDGARFCEIFNITEQGNFEGRSIPNLLESSPSADDRGFAEKCIPLVRTYRQQRPAPMKDDKKLATVNGLMLAALSVAGRLLREQAYVAEAEKTATFIAENLFHEDRLYASLRSGRLRHLATSDDYAYVLWGFFELYQATLEPRWLSRCLAIADAMLGLFKQGRGCLYLSGADVSDLPVRGCAIHDGALPSGNSIAAMVLLRLAVVTDNDAYRDAAQDIIEALSGEVSRYPAGFTGLLCAELFQQQGGIHAVVTEGSGKVEMLDSLREFNPYLTVSLSGNGEIEKLAPHLKQYSSVQGRSAVYVCSPRGCMSPFYRSGYCRS